MTLSLFPTRRAVFSSCRVYRYVLSERFLDRPAAPLCMWMLCNPSDADEQQPDPTSNRVDDFSRRWGFGGWTILNPFGYVSSDPAALPTVADPVGPDNDHHIRADLPPAGVVIVGWGQLIPKALAWRLRQVMELLDNAGATVECLGTNADGTPRHPLYLAKTTPRIPYPRI